MKLVIANWRKFRRIAVVSDVGWIRDAVRLFAPFFPHDVRIFPSAELAAARTWLTDKDESS
jgi:SpoIIAA-like